MKIMIIQMYIEIWYGKSQLIKFKRLDIGKYLNTRYTSITFRNFPFENLWYISTK